MTNPTTTATELARELASRLPNGAAELATELGVSLASVQRWLSGAARPRPAVEGKLRVVAERLAAHDAGYQPSLFTFPDQSRDEELRRALLRTCRDLRECLHRRGRLSSRHEALDELSKLLFAHVMSMSTGGSGINLHLVGADDQAASRLRGFVDDVVAAHLPLSLAHEMKADEFRLRLRETENELAAEIAACFSALERPELVAHIRGKDSVDVLNDAFGQFIADSFVDEKELGQYLTPNEVVRFMVRLGLSALDAADKAAFLDPRAQEQAGLILDPSCGVATFLTEALRLLYREVKSTQGEDAAASWVERAIRFNVVGVDKSERMLRLALTNLAMFGTEEVSLHMANSLARKNGEGGLMASFEGRAKLILTNPPFGANFPLGELGAFKLATSWATKPPRSIDSELLFMERYLDWLAPGGHLVAIVPDSILTNKGLFEDLRNHLLPLAEVKAVVSLPAVTFGVAGTTTKTSVLHLRKRRSGDQRSSSTYFAVCKDIGYDVQTRGATRTKVSSGRNQLEDILPQVRSGDVTTLGRVGRITAQDARWDATYHAGLPSAINQRLSSAATALKLREIAELSADRINPLRLGSTKDFAYIEISDVDGQSCSVRAKRIPCHEAPSRARKLVRSGDVLVSTVRPERRTVGVVPPPLDGAVCSTGFAVLRSSHIAPLTLARLLQTDFVNAQLLRDNSGIAYPAIEEAKLLDVVLPAAVGDLKALDDSADAVMTARREARRLEEVFNDALGAVVTSWLAE